MGTTPPPFTGLAIVNHHLAAALSVSANVRVLEFPGVFAERPGLASRLRRLPRLLACVPVFAWHFWRRRPAAVVIGTAAGWALLLNSIAARIALAAGTPVFLHHHSFAPLRQHTARIHHRVALRMARGSRHVVLCRCMAGELHRLHQIQPADTLLLSNAAWFPAAGRVRNQSPAPVVLGFLGSVQTGKGIFEFLALVGKLKRHHRVHARIAGEMDPALRDRVLSGCVDGILYEGIVTGSAKEDFLRGIDILVLPSRSVHESEPLVVIEALAHAVPVVATPRGCLPESWNEPPAVHLVHEDGFVDAAAALLETWATSPHTRERWSVAAAALHDRAHRSALQQLHSYMQVVLPSPPA